MAFIVKNTFLDLEEPSRQERRTSSVPRSWKPVSSLCKGDKSASLSNASTTNSDCSCHSESGDSHEYVCCMSQDGYDSPQNSPRWHEYENLPWLQDPCAAIAIANLGGEQVHSAARVMCPQESPQAPPSPTIYAAAIPSAPVVSQEAPEQQACRMWTFGATLERMEGEALGLELDMVDDISFLVTGVIQHSIVFRWNTKHRSKKKQIRIGDHIVQVNGIQGNTQQMLQAMQAPVVMLKVRQAVRESNKARLAQCNDKRTPLNARAPLFQPGQLEVHDSQGSSPLSRHMLPQLCAEAEMPPVHTRPEMMAVLSAVENSLMCCQQVGRMQKKVSKDHSSIRFSAGLQHAALANDVLSFAQECLLDSTSKSGNVYLLGCSADPFKEIKEGGFSAKLSYVPPELVGQACWDAYHQGCCPRRKTCAWNHPSKNDVIEINVVVKCGA